MVFFLPSFKWTDELEMIATDSVLQNFLYRYHELCYFTIYYYDHVFTYLQFPAGVV